MKNILSNWFINNKFETNIFHVLFSSKKAVNSILWFYVSRIFHQFSKWVDGINMDRWYHKSAFAIKINLVSLKFYDHVFRLFYFISRIANSVNYSATNKTFKYKSSGIRIKFWGKNSSCEKHWPVERQFAVSVWVLLMYIALVPNIRLRVTV